jgi:hypothetical protein
MIIVSAWAELQLRLFQQKSTETSKNVCFRLFSDCITTSEFENTGQILLRYRVTTEGV